jgi:hypothetical protein
MTLAGDMYLTSDLLYELLYYLCEVCMKRSFKHASKFKFKYFLYVCHKADTR